MKWGFLLPVKSDKYDRIFSKCVRERVDWECEHCGKYVPEGERQGFHCAHIHGRRSRSTRWDANNALGLCSSCHYYFTDHPDDFSRWCRKYLGEGYMDMLSEKANSIRKWTKAEKEEMYQHYKNEHKEMLKQRSMGVTGRITFLNYD